MASAYNELLALIMKIVAVEDHLMFRELIRRVCGQASPAHEVVGESETGAGGIALTRTFKPDLLILDLGLPDMNGLAVAKAVRAVQPAIRILILSCKLDAYTVLNVERLGLNGYVDKNTNSIAAIGAAIAAIADGKTYFSSEFLKAQRMRRRDAGSFEKILSDTEQDVLALVGDGLNDQEIATQLDIASTTAQTHRSRILKKLGIAGTPKLMAFALRAGVAGLSSRPPFPVR